MSQLKPKLYLAGPEVFLPDALEHTEKQCELCREYGFEPLNPLDNNLDLENSDIESAMKVYRGDIGQVRECDIIVANCNPFRSVSIIDDGTAYELGYGNALEKISYGYIDKLEPLEDRTVRDYPTTHNDEIGMHVDKDGYAVTDALGTSINLMMQCGMLESQGRLIEGDFEACLKAVRTDLDSGKIKL